MKFFVCLGFVLVATAADAETITTVVNRDTHTVTSTGPNATATAVMTGRSGNTATFTTTVTRNSGGYQPMGANGYNPTGR
jgi:hypothetical protein